MVRTSALLGDNTVSLASRSTTMHTVRCCGCVRNGGFNWYSLQRCILSDVAGVFVMVADGVDCSGRKWHVLMGASSVAVDDDADRSVYRDTIYQVP